MGGRSDSSTEPSTDLTARDTSGQELDDSDQVASSSTASEEQEDEIVLSPGSSVAEGDGGNIDEFNPAGEYVLDFAVEAEQGNNYSTVIMISVIALIISLGILAILVVLIRGAKVSGGRFS